MKCAKQGSALTRAIAITLALGAAAVAPSLVKADEGGISFWVPGLFGSLAASPLQPGFSFGTIYYHTSVKAGADVGFAREVPLGRITTNFSGNVNIDLKADVDLGIAVPSYTFAERFLGAQATVLMLVPYGRNKTSADATVAGNVGLGGPGFTIAGARTDDTVGFGDLAPQFNLRWNAGVDNYMTYVATNITTGRYDPNRLANLGIGHNAIDAGGGYTYLNPQNGQEFSAVLGFTYNFENTNTQYQNGVDMHLDLGTSKFVTKQLQLGLVGYAYQQLSCDTGAGDRVGCFESRVFGAGPQIGYIIPMGDHLQGYLNLKGYKEFGAQHRPEGWNTWLTFAISPAANSGTTMKPRVFGK